MPLQTACSSCSVKIKVKDELIDKSIKCPKCGKIFKAAAAEDEEKKTAVQAASAAKPEAKKPPAAWEDDEEEEGDKDSPWDKKKGKDSENGKKKPPAKKAKVEDEEDDDDDDDEEKGPEGEFKELLAQTVLPDATKKTILNELGLREVGVWVGQPDAKMMTVRAIP